VGGLGKKTRMLVMFPKKDALARSRGEEPNAALNEKRACLGGSREPADQVGVSTRERNKKNMNVDHPHS